MTMIWILLGFAAVAIGTPSLMAWALFGNRNSR